MPKIAKARVEQVLRESLGLRAEELQLQTVGGRTSGSIVSTKFRGKPDSARQAMIWDALEKALGSESVRQVGMLLAYTPDEWNAGQVIKKAKAG
jgi:acid stress-induced BolA-like protein IbaG/YrbA